MGQRSQIYVRFDNDGKKDLVANYYQWCYGERMISRARHTFDWLEANKRFLSFKQKEIARYLDVNFDMGDVVISCDIIDEWKKWFIDDDFNDHVFICQDNNDGKLFIDVTDDGIKYCFTDHNCERPMDCDEYMIYDLSPEWDVPREYLDEDDIKACKENMEFLRTNAKLMTQEELDDFVHYDYSHMYKDSHRIYAGCYDTVKSRLIDDYDKSSVDLDSFFKTSETPDLTIEETVRLYNELKSEFGDE